MDTQDVLKNLYDSFNMDKVSRNLAKRKQEQKTEAPEPIPEPVDLYQQSRDRIREVNQKSFPRGSSHAVNMSAYAVIDGMGAEGLAKAYKRAKEDIDALRARGERGRAELMRQQYMQEDFLPAVEVVVNSTSPDEVLANKKVLNELDKYVLLEGAGKGYTATYIRQAYANQLGQVEGRSDPSVRSGVQRINALLDDGQVRTAVGIANNLKDRIEKGEAMADDNDYELIGRVVSFFY